MNTRRTNKQTIYIYEWHVCKYLHRLSERNCIEIITKLVQDKKLDVVHTLDGKEYITPAQISREIRDELYVHGGQLNTATGIYWVG